MVITELNILGISIFPAKAQSPLVVDTKAMLTLSIMLERFQAIAGRAAQVVQIDSLVDHDQFASSGIGNIRRSPFGAKAGENRCGPLVCKGFDH